MTALALIRSEYYMGISLLNGFILRRPRRDDVDQVAALMNDHAQALIGRPATTPSNLQHEWESAELDNCAWLVEHERQAVGYLWMRKNGWQHPDTSGKTYRIWGCVHPDYRDSSAGERLLSAVETQAVEYGGLVEIDFRTNVEDVSMVQTLQRNGYQVIRTFWQMRRDLDPLPTARALPDGITIRAAAPADQPDIYELHMQSFRDHWSFNPYPYATWRRLFAAYPPDYDPALWFVAEEGAEKIGFVIGAPGQITVPEMGYAPEVGYVHLMGVLPDWRGRGVAKACCTGCFKPIASGDSDRSASASMRPTRPARFSSTKRSGCGRRWRSTSTARSSRRSDEKIRTTKTAKDIKRDNLSWCSRRLGG